ncbi:hypothetical protein LCGC14_2477610 [marine sediment metagenome]|uniref:Bacteriophage Mu GpT domain-containing protein n=1 Tax=marine sediment metagenome TaxID=412755 RepID=A0A0F9B8J5_9ZZZZ
MAGIIGSEITPTIGAVFIKEHWAKKAQLAARKGQVLAGTVFTDYDQEMSSGRILHIAHVLNLTVVTKDDNTVVVPNANTPTNQDITVSRYVYTAYNVQSVTDVQNEYDLIELYGSQIGYALQGDVETQLAGLPDGLSTNTVGTFGIEMTMDDWEAAWQKLQTGLAPLGQRYAWLSSAAMSALRKLGTPISADFTSSNKNALDDATMGQFLGFTLIESQYLESPATGQHDCGAQHRDQYILIRQKMPTIERERIVGDLSTLTVGWELFVTAEREIVTEAAGAESLNDSWGVWLKTV